MKIQDPIKQLELLRDWNQDCSKLRPKNNKDWPEFYILMKSIDELFDKNVKTLDIVITKLKKRNQNNTKKLQSQCLTKK